MTVTDNTSKAADTYGLTRDAQESARLNNQHVVWKKNFGFLLHPHIAASIPSNARIGDVGTGTGIWITELAEEHGNKQYSYEGLDMSSDQFPSHPPQDIKFSLLNILDPVSEDMQAKFDVLHLRLLVLGLPKGKWEQACKNLLQLLKPGGWLQWEEANFATSRVLQNKPGASRKAAQRALDVIMQEGRDRGQGTDEAPRLPSVVSSAGFDSVYTDVFSSDRDSSTREGFNQAVIGAFGGMAKMFANMDGNQAFWGTDASEKLLSDALSELEGLKIYYRSEIMVVYAQKAKN